MMTMVAMAAMVTSASAEVITVGGTDYEADILIDRDLGAGVRYLRVRLPEYPLNVNILITDLTHPYSHMETTQSKEVLGGTELLTTAAKRQTYEGHKVLAGANANFWCVSGQPPRSDLIKGWTFSANVRNGKVLTETNNSKDKWPSTAANDVNGVVGVDKDKKAYAAHMLTYATIKSSATGTVEINQINKVTRNQEICLYNSYYPAGKSVMLVRASTKYGTDGRNHYKLAETIDGETGKAAIVYLNFKPGNDWKIGEDMVCEVKKITVNQYNGTLDGYDMCLTGFTTTASTLQKLSVGDEVTVNVSWKDNNGNAPKFMQLVGGNTLSMANGELTGADDLQEGYNKSIYSRTGHGCSADGTKMYSIVIDKATDPVYGASAGCTVAKMCDIARHFGCSNLVNFDAGGSAEMLVGDKIINKTTESSPRAVANGVFYYSLAPTDNNITRLEFDAVSLNVEPNATLTPVILGYNKYGDLIELNVTGFTLTCDAAVGTCTGSTFTAGAADASGSLTATLNGVSVSKAITVGKGSSGIDDVYYGDVQLKEINVYALSGVKVVTVESDEALSQVSPGAGVYVVERVYSNGERKTCKMIIR